MNEALTLHALAASAGSPERHAFLIVRIAESADKAAFAELFAYFAPRLKGFLMRGGSPADNAEDLSQEAMLMVWRKAAQFDPARAGASTWIYTIARNLRIDAGRRGVLETISDDALESGERALSEDGADDTSAWVEASQRDARVREAVQRLPDEQSKVVMMAFFHGLAHADVARELSLPLGTVKSRLRLATQKLRSMLDAWGS
ncbi:sigma-70 family RNA polymerase sigma factor [Robbsia sp. KACC 23696]|uniref:sigma-70 family RNA polymerase sigma factor n=1 Tax=Robbsia sp. KACC 23696 TaxID=3149231 RepID=UPI00325A556A